MQATTVAAQGTASTKFNLVTFSVSLSEDGQTVPNAKTKLSRAVEGLNEALAATKQALNLEFVKNSVRESSQTNEKWEYVGKENRRELRGYTMTYSLSFDIDDLDQVSKVYDALTSIPKISVHQPAFSLKNRDRLNKRALKVAWKKVEERIAMECETLGLNKDDLEVSNWETSYSDSQRSDRVAKGATAYAASMRVAGGAPGSARNSANSADMDIVESAAAPQEPAIGFTVGLASVTVNLEVGYTRKVK
jgi:uncharacterized protein YggE